MKLAIGSVVAFGGLGPVPFADHSLVAARASWWRKQGADGIVFYDSLPGVYDAPIERFRELKAILDDTGMPAPVFNALRKGLHMPALADADERRLVRCLEVCAALGGETLDVSICSPLGVNAPEGVYAADDETFANVAERLRRIARLCNDHGLELSIELHDEGIHDSAESCLRLVELIDEPNVGVNPDLGNWFRRPDRDPAVSWEAQHALLAPKTNYWEVKNYRRIVLPAPEEPIAWPMDLDAGDIDFRAATETLWRAGFRGWVCHEGGNADRVAANVNYLRYMRWVLDDWIGTGLAG